MSHESIGVRLVRASGIIAIGKAGARAIGLITAVVTARLLTEEEFGLVGIIQSTLGIFGIAAGLALGQAATRQVALYQRNDPERARGVAATAVAFGVLSSIVTAAVLWFLSSWLAENLLGHQSLTGPLRWSTLLLVASTLYGIVSGILTGLERFRPAVGTEVLQSLISLGACMLFLPHFRVIGFVGSYALGAGISVFVALWVLRVFFSGMSLQSFGLSFRREFRPLLAFAIPLVLAGVAALVSNWLAMAVVANQPGGFVELGYYTAASRLSQIILFVAGFMTIAIFPIMTDAYGAEETGVALSRRTLEIAVAGTGIMVIPIGVLLVFGGPYLMGLFGSSYSANWSVLAPIIATVSIGAVGGAIGISLIAQGRQLLHLAQQLFYGVVTLALTYFWRESGGTGLAMAQLVGAVMLVGWSLPVLGRMGVVTRRTAITLVVVTLGVPAFAALAWSCPPGWRLPLTLPLTFIAAAVCLQMMMTRRERGRLRAAIPWLDLR